MEVTLAGMVIDCSEEQFANIEPASSVALIPASKVTFVSLLQFRKQPSLKVSMLAGISETSFNELRLENTFGRVVILLPLAKLTVSSALQPLKQVSSIEVMLAGTVNSCSEVQSLNMLAGSEVALNPLSKYTFFRAVQFLNAHLPILVTADEMLAHVNLAPSSAYS